MEQYFDKIYILYISEEELFKITNKLHNNNYLTANIEFFKGINGNSIKDEFQMLKNKNNTNIKHVGGFGHVHSMINIINDAIKNKFKKILILEPDIYFCVNFLQKIKKYLFMTYKLLYFGVSQHDWSNVNQNMLKHGFYYCNKTCGTFAFAIDSTIFNEYLTILEKLVNPSDICLFELQEKYKHQCIVTYPNLIICDVTTSTTFNWKRNQEIISDKFKWLDIYNYDDYFLFNVNKNKYKISINCDNSIVTIYLNGDMILKNENVRKSFSMVINCDYEINKIVVHSCKGFIGNGNISLSTY